MGKERRDLCWVVLQREHPSQRISGTNSSLEMAVLLSRLCRERWNHMPDIQNAEVKQDKPHAALDGFRENQATSAA